MITPSDKDYKETKLIKQGKKELNPRFRNLADWINNNYAAKVLNIYYDKTTGAYKKVFPRLFIIFEHQTDEMKFKDDLWTFNSEKQKIIAEKFKELVNNDKIDAKFHTKDLLVIFDSFEPVARTEANERISQWEIEKLKTDINNPHIWEISNFSAGATFFFYTNQQVEENENNGYKIILAEKYFQLLKKYDEFNYFSRDQFTISLDSKENFDNKYQSSWFYYYR